MEAGEVFTTPDGKGYRAIEFGLFRCASCDRETFTGLCGCAAAAPVLSGRTLVGIPLEAEKALVP